MLDKCANPDCCRPVRYLRNGKLYALYRRADRGLSSNRIEFFWLCDRCATSHDVHFCEGRPIVSPIQDLRPGAQQGAA